MSIINATARSAQESAHEIAENLFIVLMKWFDPFLFQETSHSFNYGPFSRVRPTRKWLSPHNFFHFFNMSSSPSFCPLYKLRMMFSSLKLMRGRTACDRMKTNDDNILLFSKIMWQLCHRSSCHHYHPPRSLGHKKRLLLHLVGDDFRCALFVGGFLVEPKDTNKLKMINCRKLLQFNSSRKSWRVLLLPVLVPECFSTPFHCVELESFGVKWNSISIKHIPKQR